MVIIRIKNLNNVSCKVFLLNGLLVITLVKGIQLETVYRFCIPDTKGVHNTVAISNDRKIIRNRTDTLIAFLHKIVSAVFIHMNIDITAKFNFLGIFRSAELERITVL